jgi:DNA-binding transcriptional regulator YhcF (GntR family)
MPARVNFGDAGVAFDADGALAPAAQLIAKLRLAIDSGAIPEGATLPSIRTGAAELGVHSNTLRKVYAVLETQGYATTRHGSGTVAHVRDAAGADAVRRIAEGALASARDTGADAQLVALAILSGAEAAPAKRGSAAKREGATAKPRRADARTAAPPRAAVKPPTRPSRRTPAPVLPPDIRRGAHVGLVTNDDALTARALAEAERRGVRLRVAGPGDNQTLGDLVWGCELVIVGRDARDDETAQRVLRSARDVLELA